MAVTYGFFNSVNGDRKYNAEQMSEYFRGIINEGVYQHLDGGLAVTAGTGLAVNVAAGRAIIQNRWIQNSAAMSLTIAAASETYARKDAVVIRLNWSSRAISIAVKTGTPAASPVAPSMTRNSTTYEMALAYVNVAANATSVTVTDKRSDSTVCGWVTVAQSTSGEVDAQLNAMKTGFDEVTYASPAAMVQGCDTKLNNRIHDVEDGSVAIINTASRNKSVIDNSNVMCRINEKGVYFNNTGTPFPVATLNTDVMIINETTLNKNHVYFIIAESDTAYVLKALSGGTFYWKKDNSSYKGLGQGETMTLPTIVSISNGAVSYCGYSKTEAEINTLLASESVSDTVHLKLGVSCNNVLKNTLLPLFIVPDFADDMDDLKYALLHSKDGIIQNNVSVQQYADGIEFGESSTYCYMTIFNTIAYLGALSGEGGVVANSVWPILAETTNGFVFLSMNGQMYYATKSLSILSSIDSLYSVELPTYIILKDNSIRIGDYVINKAYIDARLTASSINDPVTSMRIGMACNKAIPQAGGRIPFIYTGSDNAGKWEGKTGDFLGDSLTAQGKYTGALSSLYNITVNNYGISGTCISDVNGNNYFSTRVSSMSDSCDFVFVMGGTNDWGLGAPIGTKADTTASTFYGGLYLLFSALRTKFPTKQIFVSTITQRDWQGGGQASGIDSNANSNSIMQFNEAIEYMAHRYGCIVIDGFGESGICVSNIDTYTSDKLHFNDDGGVRFADFVISQMNDN